MTENLLELLEEYDREFAEPQVPAVLSPRDLCEWLEKRGVQLVPAGYVVAKEQMLVDLSSRADHAEWRINSPDGLIEQIHRTEATALRWMKLAESAQEERDHWHARADSTAKLSRDGWNLSAEKAAEVARLRRLLRRLNRGDCWCDVGIGNPMMRGQHSAVCDEVRAALA